ncbi:MAG TPA: hypothetical protein VN772_04485 [Solirubrobacteraceae bacterium]|nr:hypothetical protein [Solirubrobacteraceae bacterium]
MTERLSAWAGAGAPPQRARKILRRAALPALLGALALATNAQAGAGPVAPGGAPPAIQLYEWLPNGRENGPFVVIEVKRDITGKFAVECGKTWIFSYYGGGEADPIIQNLSTGAISGTYTFSQNSAGIGSTYLSASTDYYLVKKAGPLVMTMNAQPTPWPVRAPAAASGTLKLTLYTPGSVVPATTASGASKHKRRKHKGKAKAKPKTSVVASCTVAFNAANYYAPL